MAQMIDDKNTDFAGEAIVWEKLKEFLPDDAIVYFNREVLGRTYDFCVLLENKGILIIEVKGWKSDQVKVNKPDDIEISGYDKHQLSPRKQAYGYQYKLRELFHRECGVCPLYFNMVCYPFINEQDFARLRLDLVSPAEFTLLKDDLEDKIDFNLKIDSAYDNEKNDHFDPMTKDVMGKIRRYYEPNYEDPSDNYGDNDVFYSKLWILLNGKGEIEQDGILREYFQGTKQIIFTDDHELLRDIVENLKSNFQKRDIYLCGNDLKKGESLVKDEDLPEDSFRCFNFEIYYVGNLATVCQDSICITEGKYTEHEKKILLELGTITKFNYQQYIIEHSPTQKNILVQAGAGTGKTYSMVSRIAFLCNKSNEPVKNIASDIALVTFTNDAANNMKDRIRQMFMNYFVLTGDTRFFKYIEDVEQANISTIHKFALTILHKESLHTGLSSEFSISRNELFRRQRYEAHLSDYIEMKTEFDGNFISRIPVPLYEFVQILMDFTDKLKNKSIDMTKVNQSEIGTPKVNDLPNFNEIIEDVIKPSEEDYLAYQWDNDMIDLNECLILLKRVLDEANGKIHSVNLKYLFIDEFQDTDNVQIDIFKELQKKMEDDCKLFVVGDLKQSIYRFRGATISAFDKLVGNRTDVWEKFTLNINYRTDKKLLEEFDQRFDAWGRKGYLIYKKEDDKLYSNININNNVPVLECRDYHGNSKDDFFDVLFDTIKQKKSQLEDIDAKEHLSEKERTIAILTRSNWQIEEIVKKGRELKIPIETTAGGKLYNLSSTIDLYKLILALCNPNNPIYLTNLIDSNYVNVDLDYNSLHGLNYEEKRIILTGILDEYFKKKTGEKFSSKVNKAYEKPILYVLQTLYEDLMPWNNYSFDSEKQQYYKINYEYLLEKIIRSGQMEAITLTSIKHFLDVNVRTDQHEEERQIDSEEQNGIKILCSTVHKAKGLEYGTVIIPYTEDSIGDLGKNKLEVDWNENKLSYYIRFSKDVEEYNSYYDEKSESNNEIKEETRVLYVALTRAIRNCVWLNDVDNVADISWSSLLEEK